MDMMIAGLMKRRIEKYKEIVKSFLSKQNLSKEQTEFLEKEGVLK